MSKRVKRCIKAILFVVIALVILAAYSFIVQPVWMTENYDTTNGFYSEPDNTIETIFLGSSHVKYGISPMQLYEEYGICAYDLSTDAQPVLASYFWLEEAYRHHSKTLDTVVLDASMLTRDPDIAFYHEALDPMKLSMVKLRSIKAYSEDFENFVQNMFSLLSYHERWQELTFTDLLKYEYEPEICTRGYQYNTSQWINNVSTFSAIDTPLIVADEKEQDTILDDTAILYFKKMIDFCEENNLQMLLIKTPTNWTSGEHNAVQDLADNYGLDFIDFNVDPYYSEVDFNFATDLINPRDLSNLHSNYYGADKMTDYLGSYLVDKYGNRDTRGEEKYAFIEEELDQYHQYIALRQALLNATNPCDYIETALEGGDFTIFISVKDDAATSLTEEQRTYFESIGLVELSQLTYGEAYLAVIDNGKVITEQYQKDPGKKNATDDLISYTGALHNGTSYTVISGGYHMGNTSSIVIENTERSSNKRGLNLVIYDNKMQRYVANAVFDTYDAPERSEPFNEQSWEMLMEEGVPVSELTGTDRILYLYNRECEDKKTAAIARQSVDKGDGLIAYVKNFWDEEDIDVFAIVQGDASNALTDSMQESLYEHEVEIIEGNNNFSIIVNETEYQVGQDGISIVIYDTVTEMVVDTITFDLETEDTDETGAKAE